MGALERVFPAPPRAEDLPVHERPRLFNLSASVFIPFRQGIIRLSDAAVAAPDDDRQRLQDKLRPFLAMIQRAEDAPFCGYRPPEGPPEMLPSLLVRLAKLAETFLEDLNKIYRQDPNNTALVEDYDKFCKGIESCRDYVSFHSFLQKTLAPTSP